MITIVNYRERYQSDVEALDAEMAAEIARHADVCRDTICVALADGVFAGVGLIMEPGTEDEAEVSITLLEELQYRFGRLRGRDGRKPVLRLWVKAEDTAYTELLFDEGFRVGNVMTVMTRGIDDTDELLAGEEQAEPEDNRGPAYEPEPEPQYAADSAEFFRGKRRRSGNFTTLPRSGEHTLKSMRAASGSPTARTR